MNRMVSLLNPGNLIIMEEDGSVSYGCNQDWYRTEWQRRAGCGPCTASNIFLYMQRNGSLTLPLGTKDKADCVQLMESLWRHVTPRDRGVNRTEIFLDGVKGFSRENEYQLQYYCLDIPEEVEKRPPWPGVQAFIAEGLEKDCPVAFLNLSNGQVENLDRWHWVTIVSLETDDESGDGVVCIYDGVKTALIDLKLWYETTTMDGGFVYIQK